MLLAWRAQSITVVLYQEDHGEFPYRGNVQRFMEVAFAGGAVAAEGEANLILFAELVGQCYAVGNRELRAEVTDHAADVIFIGAEVEAALAAFRVAFLAALPLHEELVERHLAGSEHTEVAVHGHDVLVAVEGEGRAHGDGFLTDAGKPLGKAALAQEHEQFLLDHPGTEELSVEVDQFVGAQAVALKLHGRKGA